MKKLVNDPRDVVIETVRGFAMAHSRHVVLHEDPVHLRRADAPVAGKVAILSGGGSGHEPLHAGFIGPGMLDAAVPGPVFTSPTPDPIVEATRAVDSGAGVLHIVKNYTGDVLNFETAAELAAVEGIRVASVLVDDDVAVQDSLFTAGRRRLEVEDDKWAGAAADGGDDLETVEAVARLAIARTRSMGLALAPGTVPHAGEPSFTLADDEVELGIGIHGEPGRERIPMAPVDQLVDRVLGPVLADLDAPPGSSVLLFVNGMGGTPLSELYIVFARAAAILADEGLVLSRSLVGNYVTSLEMQGFSITVTVLDEDTTALWDAPVETPALRWGR
jgi:dihydroxyacetone kinase-like protein